MKNTAYKTLLLLCLILAAPAYAMEQKVTSIAVQPAAQKQQLEKKSCCTRIMHRFFGAPTPQLVIVRTKPLSTLTKENQQLLDDISEIQREIRCKTTCIRILLGGLLLANAATIYRLLPSATSHTAPQLSIIQFKRENHIEGYAQLNANEKTIISCAEFHEKNKHTIQCVFIDTETGKETPIHPKMYRTLKDLYTKP
ncbi:MAG: hypothetical protein NTX86_03630 [Candidatus Dependentiae bacterium]|nr:hypothetical protein [Candidatus Dependentiae bacterium]